MKGLDRRSVLAGIGVAATAAPIGALAQGVGKVVTRSPREQFEYHVREVEKALLDCYPGSKVVTMGEGRDPSVGFNPYILIVAQSGKAKQ